MKKKFVSLFAAAAMMFALPGVALAVDSPEGNTVTDSESGVAITVDESGIVQGSIESVTVATEAVAEALEAAAEEGSTITILASFEVVGSDDLVIDPETGLQLTFSVGEEWAGYTAIVYIAHSDGTSEQQAVTVSDDGTVTVTVFKLSTFTVAVDESTAPTTSAATTDTSSTSPATAANLLPVLCMTVAATAGAGVSAVSLRKRLSK